VLAQRAEQELIATIEDMRRRFCLSCTRDQLVTDIKATMHIQLPPHNFEVIQVLCDRERAAKAFNQSASEVFPAAIRKGFDDAIQDFVIIRRGKTSARELRKIAGNAWKWDHAEDRRIRKAAFGRTARSPRKGRPELYDPEVVAAFADAVARAAGRPKFSIGHHGDEAITEKNKAGSVMLRVLVAAVRWSMTVAWQVSAPWESAPPIVKPEGLLSLIKRGR
jgi:hypothetical protein